MRIYSNTQQWAMIELRRYQAKEAKHSLEIDPDQVIPIEQVKSDSRFNENEVDWIQEKMLQVSDQEFHHSGDILQFLREVGWRLGKKVLTWTSNRTGDRYYAFAGDDGVVTGFDGSNQSFYNAVA